MKISKASDYALVFLATLAELPQGEWVSARSVGEKIGIPASFLGNIVHELVQAGILKSQRGAHGGVQLAKTSKEITIGQVLSAMDDGMNLVECMSEGGNCPIESNCDIRSFWSVTHELVLAALKHISLHDIQMYMHAAKQKGILTHVSPHP